MPSVAQVSTRGQAALTYAERFGWAVLPLHSSLNGRCTCGRADCPSPGKHPLTPHGVADATKDPAVIAEWWRRWPWANVGVATGEKSGFFVLDIDGEEGEESLRALEAKYGKLPATVEALTGGGGRHILFRCPGKPVGNKSNSDVGHKIHVKGDGGYIVAPPSLHISGRPYVWELSSYPGDVPIAEAPEWLIELVAGGNGRRLQPEDWERTILEGERNIELTRRAGKLLAMGFPAGETLTMLLSWNVRHCKPPLPEREVRAIVESIAKRETGKQKQALRQNRDQNHEGTPGDRPAPQIRFWTGQELLNADFPEPEWLVPDLLPEGGLVLLAGKPKIGKSWLALDIATGLAGGDKVCGVSVARRAKTLYLALEDTPRRLKSRLAALGSPPSTDCLIATGWLRLDSGGLGLLEKTVTERGVEVVIIDTLAKLRPREDKATSLYAADYETLGGLKGLADRLGITVVVVHHLRKAGAEDPLEEVSGTTGLTGAVDTVLVLKRSRGAADATLFITGRDTEEREMALRFEGGRWRMLGEAKEYAISQERRQVLEAIRELGGAARPKEIAELTGRPHGSVKHLLRKLEAEGVVRSVGGVYTTTTGHSLYSPHSPYSLRSPYSPCSPCSPVNAGEWGVNDTVHPEKASRDGDFASRVNAVNGVNGHPAEGNSAPVVGKADPPVAMAPPTHELHELQSYMSYMSYKVTSGDVTRGNGGGVTSESRIHTAFRGKCNDVTLVTAHAHDGGANGGGHPAEAPVVGEAPPPEGNPTYRGAKVVKFDYLAADSPTVARPSHPPGVCPTCGGSDFWQSRWGWWFCRTCHPPAPGAEAYELP